MEIKEFFRKLFSPSSKDETCSLLDLEHRLSQQLLSGNVFGTLATLKMMGRPFLDQERISLIRGCLVRKSFCEAFYLTRGILVENERNSFLQIIVREAAYFDDFSTARAAALLLERQGK